MKGSISVTNVLFVFAFLVYPAANSHDLGVYDDIFTESNLSELSTFVSDILTWKQGSIIGREKELAVEKTFWHSSSHQDVLFSKTNSWKSIQELVMSRLDNDGRSHGDKLWPVNVRGRVLLRGDLPRIEKINNSSTLTLFVFMCEKWKKNFYGEMLFFSNNNEYLKSVHVRSGRVVLVPGSVGYVVKPPSMNTEQTLLVISLGVTSNVATLLVSSPPPDYNDITLTLSPREPNSWQIAEHISKEFQTTDKKKIVVFDNVFTQDELNRFLEKIENGVYHYQPPNPDSEDNVMWILGLEVSNLLQSDLWTIFKKALMAATGSETYYPYDVSCNNIHTWHHPKVHKDCRVDENDYTLLVYLTPNWTHSYYGETVFYSDDEIFAVVRPKFGRLVIFHGAIPHSARSPSPTYKGSRYTFAMKCAPSKERAMRKSLILSFERLLSFDAELVGQEKAAEMTHFITMLENGEGEHEEMEKLGIKFENELDELEET